MFGVVSVCMKIDLLPYKTFRRQAYLNNGWFIFRTVTADIIIISIQSDMREHMGTLVSLTVYKYDVTVGVLP